MEDHPANYCGDCYGADSPDVRCCNTCNDLIQAYQRKQWSVTDILRNATQCIHDRAKHFANLGADEGCTVSGKMLVNKVAGNFHIAHGESIVRDGRHIHQFNPALAPKFNVSHTIHSISFGDPYPSMPANPLDKGIVFFLFMIIQLTQLTDNNALRFTLFILFCHLYGYFFPSSEAHHCGRREHRPVPVLRARCAHHLHGRIRQPDPHQPVHHH